jgi:glycosyltransferase involved in cell wall biosynthesis
MSDGDELIQAERQRIAFLLDNLAGGGAEQVLLNLARGFRERGYSVDLLVCDPRGKLAANVPDNVNLVLLKRAGMPASLLDVARADLRAAILLLGLLIRQGKLPSSLRYLPLIARYLVEHRPAVLMSALPKSNINAILASKLARVDTRVTLGVHIHLSALEAVARQQGKMRMHYLRPLMQHIYRNAEHLVAVSAGVASDAAEFLAVDPARISVIYNPVAPHDLDARIAADPQHPWLSDTASPLILSIGRLVEQKNFPLLLHAFALLRRQRPARLMILGGDPESAKQQRRYQQLLALAGQLRVQADVELVRYVDNPYAYLSRASLFALSSRFEGFGNVIIEALLCGCPVVSTDCPSGPAEILDHGRFGTLVPIDDPQALAQAMQNGLDAPVDRAVLRARGQEFGVEAAVQRYERLLFGRS